MWSSVASWEPRIPQPDATPRRDEEEAHAFGSHNIESTENITHRQPLSEKHYQEDFKEIWGQRCFIEI